MTADVLLLAVALGLLAVATLAGQLGAMAGVLRSSRRPALPDDDRPPAGLGRLVPVGEQVDLESGRGVAALERWLATRRRTAP